MFDPYGKVTICNPDGSEKTGVARVCSAFGNPFFFTGRRNDDETRWFDSSKPAGKEWQQGLMQFRFRYYDTGLGRFVSRDLTKGAARSISLYDYARSAPTSFVDAYGLLENKISHDTTTRYTRPPRPDNPYGVTGPPFLYRGQIQGVCELRSCKRRGVEGPCFQACRKSMEGWLNYTIFINRDLIEKKKPKLDCDTGNITLVDSAPNNNVINADTASVETHENLHRDQLKSKIEAELAKIQDRCFSCKKEDQAKKDMPMCETQLTKEINAAIDHGVKAFDKDYGAGGWKHPMEMEARRSQCRAQNKTPKF